MVRTWKRIQKISWLDLSNYGTVLEKRVVVADPVNGLIPSFPEAIERDPNAVVSINYHSKGRYRNVITYASTSMALLRTMGNQTYSRNDETR